MIAKTVETYGTIDILVNNAGVVDNGMEAIEKVTDKTIIKAGRKKNREDILWKK